MPRSLWRFITNLGDAGVLLPLAALLALSLWRYASPRAAWLFVRAVVICGAVLAVLKLAFISCGPHLDWDLQSPSGHTGMSIMVYGALALVAISALQHNRAAHRGSAHDSPAHHGADVLRMAIALGAAPLIAAIAVSRIALRFHSLTEVVLGAGVGLAALSMFMLPYRELRQHPRLPFVGLAAGAAVVLALTYGAISPAEHFIRYLSEMLSAGLKVCR
jgi:membrane-associated phospholipid phosphatase